MRKITGKEDFKTPIMLLFFFSMVFVSETTTVFKTMQAQNSIFFSQPILFTDNLPETISKLCWFIIPATLIYEALKERDIFLKLIYFMGSIPLILTDSIVNKLGFKFLALAKVLILFAVVMCLIRYLMSTTDLYKRVIEKNIKSDNHAAPGDGEKARRP